MTELDKAGVTWGFRGYPRPLLERAEWTSLDGEWDFCLDARAEIVQLSDVRWNATIEVPFSPETEASGVGNTGFYCVAWYRRSFEAPALDGGRRLLLHFGAVDYSATVWVNGCRCACTRGGIRRSRRTLPT